MTTIFVTQHFRPDETSTSTFLTAIAEHLSQDDEVIVLSGTEGSAVGAARGRLRVHEVANRQPAKSALARRSLAMAWFCVRAFWFVLWTSSRTTPVFTVTTPFLLPYFTVLAARLRGAPAALIVYDLYPEALVASGMTTANSLLARLIRRANARLFRSLSVAIVIGHDMEKSILRYPGISPEKIRYIPNWATLAVHNRPIDQDNPFRGDDGPKIVVGMSGNLGFTHDPATVFEAARLLAAEKDIVFMLSGWGVGWDQLVQLQREAKLSNVRLIERVPESRLEDFLAAANLWIIPYRKKMAGISVPSRLCNLLAVGRPVLALAESEAEYAHLLDESGAGWVVEPENPEALADMLLKIASNPTLVVRKGENALRMARGQFNNEAIGKAYRATAQELRTT